MIRLARQLGVRFVEPDVHKERLIGICLGFQPVDRITDDDLAGITFHRPHCFAVAHKVGGIPVTGICAIGQAKPVVKTVILE